MGTNFLNWLNVSSSLTENTNICSYICMKLPYTSSKLVAYIDPSEKFITKDANNKVYSVIDRISGNPIIQTDNSAQPTWSSNAMGKNNPGINFTTNQCLFAHYIAKYFNEGNTPITIIVTFKTSSIYVNNNSGLALYFLCTFSESISTSHGFFGFDLRTLNGAKGIVPFYINDSGQSISGNIITFDNPSPVIANVGTIIYNGTSVIFRLNGQTLLTKTTPSGPVINRDRFTIGRTGDAFVPGFPWFYEGSMGHILVFRGGDGVPEIERALMDDLNQ